MEEVQFFHLSSDSKAARVAASTDDDTVGAPVVALAVLVRGGVAVALAIFCTLVLLVELRLLVSCVAGAW